MKKIQPIHIAWLIPLVHLIHFGEELLMGLGFPTWAVRHFDANMLEKNFITINIIAFTLMFLIALFYSLGARLNLLLIAFATLYFVNGFAHFVFSVFSCSYSPGLVTGLLLFIPLGIISFKIIFPQLSKIERITGIAIGILIHIIGTSAALSN